MASSAEIGRDAFGPHFENLVVTIHLLEVVDVLRNRSRAASARAPRSPSGVVGHAADADITHRQPAAAAGFDQVVDFFARPEAVPEVADRAEVDEVRADADQVIGDAAELRENHADVLRALRNFDAEHLFDGHRIRDAVHHRRHVIQAIGEGNHLPVRVRFGHLFETAMQVADLRIRIDDLFAVDRDLQPERSVHRGMLRAEIQNLRMRQIPSTRHISSRARRPADRSVSVHMVRWPGGKSRRKRMSFELRMRQNSPQVRMAFELDAEHVERFALGPVGAFPDVDGADRSWDRRRAPAP